MASAWQFWALAAALFAALTALLAKLGVGGMDPDLATLLRSLVVGLILAAVLAVQGRLNWSQLETLPRGALLALLLSAVATGLSWLCYFRALQLGPVAGVAALDKLSVVLVALLAATLLQEPLQAKGWAGVLLMAAGALLVGWS